jgi:hypothetical protein
MRATVKIVKAFYHVFVCFKHVTDIRFVEAFGPWLASARFGVEQDVKLHDCASMPASNARLMSSACSSASSSRP